MNISERIKELSDKEMVSMYTISKETGVSQSTLSRLINGKTENISRRSLKILADYFHVGLEWLISGEGSPYLDSTSERTKLAAKTRIIKYITTKGIPIEDFAKSIKSSIEYWDDSENDYITPIHAINKALKRLPELNPVWVFTGEGEMLKPAYNIENAPPAVMHEPSSTYNPAKQTRPRIPYTAAAGSLTSAVEGVMAEQCEQIPRIVAFPDYDFTIIIKGNSMEPKYEGGDEVACKRVDSTSFIQWGKVHVMDTSQGIVIKRVYEDGDKIRCVSYNPEYPDFSISKDEIYSMSLVVGLLRM